MRVIKIFNLFGETGFKIAPFEHWFNRNSNKTILFRLTSDFLNVDTSTKSKYIIFYLLLCTSINYSLFLTSCILHPAASWTSFSFLPPKALVFLKHDTWLFVETATWFKLFYFLVWWQLCWCKCKWNTFFITSSEW